MSEPERVAIVGGPKAGKTTLAGVGAKHSDDLMDLGWSEASAAAARWFDEPGPWVVEGVAVVRALRKWLAAHEGDARPCDRVIYLSAAHEPLGRGQKAMAKGCRTVWEQIREELQRRGVIIEDDGIAAAGAS